MHAITQNQSSFSIGVSDLDSQSLSALDDVRWSVGIGTDEVFNQTDGASEVDGDLFFNDGFKG